MNTAPRLSNGLTGAAYATLGAVTSITCDEGYASSTAPTAPFFTCNTGTASAGVWSSIYGTCVTIAAYCNSSLAPIIANANTPTPQTSVNAITTFTCNAAYESTGYQNGASPYYVCLPGSSIGVWSPVTYGCQLIPNYCSNNPAESSSDTVAPSSYFVASLGAEVNLSCPAGAALVSGSLNVTCLYSTATKGLWSVATAKCYASTSPISTTTTTVTTTTAWVPPWWIWTIVGVTCLIFLAFISMLSALLFVVYCSRSAARAAATGGNFSTPSTPRRIKLRNAVSPILK
jgi:hypothetical protein